MVDISLQFQTGYRYADYKIGLCVLGRLTAPWLILGLHPANEKRRYKATLFLIGWA